MSQISKGTTYGPTSPDNQVTYINLNAHVDSATLLPGAITDQTSKTVPASGDQLLLHSAADTALRQVSLANLFGRPLPIGSTIANTGAFTTLTADTGAFTTLTADSATILNGTANLVECAADTLSCDVFRINAELGYGTSGAIALAFSTTSNALIFLTGNATFSFLAITAGAQMKLALKNNTGSPITLTWPAFVTAGAAIPTSLSASQTIIVDFFSYGTTIGSVWAKS